MVIHLTLPTELRQTGCHGCPFLPVNVDQVEIGQSWSLAPTYRAEHSVVTLLNLDRVVQHDFPNALFRP